MVTGFRCEKRLARAALLAGHQPEPPAAPQQLPAAPPQPAPAGPFGALGPGQDCSPQTLAALRAAVQLGEQWDVDQVAAR